MTTIKITKIKEKPFTSADGEQITYFWYSGKIIGGDKDGVSIQFGSAKGDRIIGEKYDINLDKVEFSNGKIGYKEVSE